MVRTKETVFRLSLLIYLNIELAFGFQKVDNKKNILSRKEVRTLEMERTQNKADALAEDVLTLARNTLLVNLRFLDAALSQFTPTLHPGTTLATDGQTLYYDTVHVLRTYKAEHAVPARDQLHLLLHCVFRHIFPRQGINRELWDLACDIAAEHAVTGFGLLAVTAEREQKQQIITSRIQREIGMLTAEKVYRYLERKPYWLDEFEDIPSLFRADDHDLWYEDRLNRDECESFWKDVSRRMQVDMETFARKQGDKALAMMQNLREVNRESYDYAGFLQKFASRGEVMKSNPEEFDYIFYTYGMNLYDNMPLIEPVEYKDVKKVRDFVLAVDLCGLISTAQAKRFLRKAFEVFKRNERSRLKMQLHFLACGGTEPVYKPVSTEEELEEFLRDLRLHYREQCDFRPAFLWTDDMLHRGRFRNLKGLLYFTDSTGPFPPSKPAHDAAIVFVNDNYSTPDVPPWAIRLVLQKDELDERT